MAAMRSDSVRRGELYDGLSLEHDDYHIMTPNPFAEEEEEPAQPAPVRQATHPALQAARAAATTHRAALPVAPLLNISRPAAHEPAMPPSASGMNGTMSPSGYAQQFQSFSDTKPVRIGRKPSLFRRSVSALTGNGQSGTLQRAPSKNGGGLQRKPSALRKSMAWLLGPPQPVRLAPGMGDTPATPVAEKSNSFWGAGDEGQEWDVDGSGAAFWKRFSVAQRHAQNEADPMTVGSKQYVGKQNKTNRIMRWSIYLVIILVIALIVGLAVGIPASHKHSSSNSASGLAGSSSESSGNNKRALMSIVPTELGSPVSVSVPVPVPTAPVTKRQGRTHTKLAHRQAVHAAQQN